MTRFQLRKDENRVATPQDPRALLSALCLHFRLAPVRLALMHGPKPVLGDGSRGEACFVPRLRTIKLWVHTPEKRAHEFAHCLQRDRDTEWPIDADWLGEVFPAEVAAALDELERLELAGAYSERQFGEGLFARIFESVYAGI